MPKHATTVNSQRVCKEVHWNRTQVLALTLSPPDKSRNAAKVEPRDVLHHQIVRAPFLSGVGRVDDSGMLQPARR